jgi:hypothetical protein
VSAYDRSLDWLFWIEECVRHLERTGDTQLATEVRNEYEIMRSMLRRNAQLEAALDAEKAIHTVWLARFGELAIAPHCPTCLCSHG